MKKIILLFVLTIIFFLSGTTKAENDINKTTGYILLQVEKNGEAWYVYPQNQKRYYLGRPDDAFKIMKQLALGAKHDYIFKTDIFPDRLSGVILLDVEKNGEAYYIYPSNKKKYYLGRPDDAFKIMRELGLGINNSDLNNISSAVIEEPIQESTNISQTNKKILIGGVPFTSQAPYGDWADMRQENGCEEASALMAVKWARNEGLTKDEALKEITGLSDFLLKKYGEYNDVSNQDTVDWIFRDYFNYNKISLTRNITLADIIYELSLDHVVLTQMDGQLMHNPNFKAPGPERHMIVIRGYDPTTKELITNDPGTRKGELYRYDADSLYKAIRDYPTGYHKAITKIEKSMLVVTK
ncbi:MAG: C39 family peptidase [Patescibacteria group bacterium]